MPIKKTRPMPTGVPGIQQDGPSRFLVTVTWNDKRTGQRRKREGVAETLAKAVELKSELRGVRGTRSPSRTRFAGFAEQWIAVRSKSKRRPLAPSTANRYVNELAHLTVHFGNWWVDAFDDEGIEEWQEQAAETMAIETVNGQHRTLRLVLDRAVRDGLLQSNPARSVSTLPTGRTKGKRGTSLDGVEFSRFMRTTSEMAGSRISPDIARHAQTLGWTGMRMGESLALKWDDIVDGELRVERSVWHRKEKATKTDDPRRITIVGPLAQALEEQRQWLLKGQHPGLESGLVFPARPRNAKGSATRRGVDEVVWYRSHSVLAAPLGKISAKAEIPAISPQSLRRTFENLLRNAGVEQLVRRAVAGWRSDKAQGIYAEVSRADRDAAAAAFVKLVESSAQKKVVS